MSTHVQKVILAVACMPFLRHITHGSISPWYHNILSLSHTILVQTMDAFYEKVTDPKHNGAAFFAVCRGKVGTVEHSARSMCIFIQVYLFYVLLTFLNSSALSGLGGAFVMVCFVCTGE